jgi:hypothetical protein
MNREDASTARARAIGWFSCEMRNLNDGDGPLLPMINPAGMLVCVVIENASFSRTGVAIVD